MKNKAEAFFKMKKNPLMNRILSLVLCAGLIFSEPVSVLAGEVNNESTTDESKSSESKSEESNSSSSNSSSETSSKSSESEEKSEEKSESSSKEDVKKSDEKASDEDASEKEDAESEDEEADAEKKLKEDASVEEKNETEECEHIDEDEDGICDLCGEEIEKVDEEEEKEPSLVYEDDEVVVTVSGAVPENCDLVVLPIKEDDDETASDYKEVEEKIEADAEENDYEIFDFLAYDISFVDIESGEEIEPEDDVKVNLDYKESVIPDAAKEEEGVAVSVLHINEVKDKVEDLTEAGNAEINTTKDKAVKDVEITSDTFSKYVITWNDRNRLKLNLYYYDTEMNALPGNNNNKKVSVSLKNNKKTISLADYEDEYSGYTFRRAVVFKDGYTQPKQWKSGSSIDKESNLESHDEGQIPGEIFKNEYEKKADSISVEYKNSKYTVKRIYKNNTYSLDDIGISSSEDSSNGAYNNSNVGICFIYDKDSSLNERPDVSGEIGLNLFDYTVSDSGRSEAASDSKMSQGINRNHDLKFSAYYNNRKNYGEQNDFTGDRGNGLGYAYQGIVKNKLADGYPVINFGNKDSLSYLFNEQTNDNKSAYIGLNGLFKYDENTGYYSYDSDKEFATIAETIDDEKPEFKVYKGKKVGFYPFTAYANADSYDSKDKGDDLGSPYINHFFGMTVDTAFIQPKDGKIKTGDDMIYEFSGDDDLWVFIDDVLVLDIGGIHQKVSGKINFATGVVTVDAASHTTLGTSTTIKKAFEKAGVTDESLFKNDTFADNTAHTMKMFYLERGNDYSNCMVKFNLQTLPKGALYVSKNVNSSEKIDPDTGYGFRVYDQNTHPIDASYKIFDAYDKEVFSGKTTDGTFVIKDGQYALFDGLPDGNYQVVEERIENSSGGKYTISDFVTTVTLNGAVKNIYSSGNLNEKKSVIAPVTAAQTTLVTFSNVYNHYDPVSEPYSFVSKTAEDYNYLNRQAKIVLETASGDKVTKTNSTEKPIDVMLCLDVSGSMDFHTGLVKANVTNSNINSFDKNTTYYTIGNDSSAFVYRYNYIYNGSKSGWVKTDDALQSNSNKIISGNPFESAGTVYVQSSETMGKLRGDYMKEATKSLIDKLPVGTKVSLVSFYSNVVESSFDSADSYHNKANGNFVDDHIFVITADNRGKLKSKIDSLYNVDQIAGQGGTNQNLGLSAIANRLEQSGLKDDKADKYVVFVTDGCPNGCTKDEVIAAANRIKSNDAKIISVGVDLQTITSANDTASGILNKCASDGNVFKAESSQLASMFDEISTIITNTTTEYIPDNGDVVDVVDNRFILIADDGNKIVKNGTYMIAGRSASVTISEDGFTKIVWHNQELGSLTGDKEKPISNWKAEFIIEAKANFMGGNIISTNTTDSGVKPNGKDFMPFDVPTINVRLLNINLLSKEKTVFLNEQISPQEIKAELLKQLTGTNFQGLENGEQVLDDDQIKVLLEKGSFEYAYKNTNNDVVGKFTCQIVKEPADDEFIISRGLLGLGEKSYFAKKTGQKVYAYTLEVKYEPISYEDRDRLYVNQKYIRPHMSSSEHVVKTTIKATADYLINVVAAKLDVTKISGSTKEKLAGAKYKLTTKDGYIENEKFNGSLSVENMTGSLLEFANLGLGTYELEEVSAPSGYALSEDIYTVVIAPVGEGVYTVKITKKDAGTKVETEVLSKQLTFANQFENFGGINKMVATLAFEVEDMVAYSLPETGGSGVYIYIIGGILLMFAGVLLLYKNKKIIK